MASTTFKNWYPQKTLTSGGGTLNLDAEEQYNIYLIDGTATLAASWTIQGTNVGLGQEFWLKYEAVLTLNGNTLTIFGKSIDQGLANRPFLVHAVYDGSGWDTTIIPTFSDLPFITADMLESNSVSTAKIVDDAVTADKLKDSVGTDADRAVTTDHIRDSAITTAKINDGDVTLAKLDPTLLVQTLVFPVSFEAGEQCDNSFIIDFDGTINEVTYYVTKAIAATDDADIDVEIGCNPTTPSNINITASSALNTTATLTVTSNNAFSAGDVLSFISSKSTAGGKALVSVKVTRT